MPGSPLDHTARIFVSIASFCDAQLLFTVDSLFGSAAHPERIFPAIVDQHPHDRRNTWSTHPNGHQIRYVYIDPVDSRGVSWARSVAFSLYRGEALFLQVDSHTWFEAGWDTRLIRLLSEVEALYPKAILSCYPPGFHFTDAGEPQMDITPTTDVMALAPLHDATFSENRLICGFGTRWIPGLKFSVGSHLAGGFIFTRGDFVEAIPYDPYMYFSGEEQNLAVRAWTHGWDILHPRMCDVPLAHLYKRAGTAHQEHHWREDLEARRTEKWPELQDRAQARFCRLTGPQSLPGAYGLGTVRTLAAFAELSGLDYRKHRLRRPPCPPHEAQKRIDMSGFGRVAIPTDMGLLTGLANDAYELMALEAHGTLYAAEIELLMRGLPPNVNVIQVGGFVGYQSLQLATRLNADGCLYVFEAQVQLRTLLAENLALRSAQTRVFLSDKAVWDTETAGHMPPLSHAPAARHGAWRFVPQQTASADLPLASTDSTDSTDSTGQQSPVACLADTVAIPLDSLQLTTLEALHVDIGADSPRVLRGALNTIARCQPRIMVLYDETTQAEVNRLLPALTGYTFKRLAYAAHADEARLPVAGLIPADSKRTVLLMLPARDTRWTGDPADNKQAGLKPRVS